MGKGTRPDPNQLFLTDDPGFQRRQQEVLDRHERLALIETAFVLERVVRVLPSMTATRVRNAKRVLEKIASMKYGKKFPLQSSLAKWIGCSERTVKRAIADLVTLEILASDRRGRTSNVYAIDYRRLAVLGAASSGQIAPFDGPGWPGEGANLARREGQLGPADQPLIGINTTHNSHNTNVDDEWQPVEVVVQCCGVSDFKRAVSRARDLGAIPAEVLAVVDYWKKHRAGWDKWAQRYLHARLVHWAPGLSAHQGWPAFTDEYARSLKSPAGGDPIARETLQQRQASAEARANAAPPKLWIAMRAGSNPTGDAEAER